MGITKTYFVRRSLILLMAVLPFWGFAQTSDISISTRLDKDSILIGDQVKLIIKASYPVGQRFRYPDFQDTLMRGLEVLTNGSIDTLGYDADKKRIKTQRTYVLTSFQGNTLVRFPGFAFTFPAPSGMDTIRTNALTLKVFYPRIDSTFVPHEIYDPVKYPINFAEIKPYLLGLHLILLVALITYVIVRKLRRKEKIFGSTEPKIPPRQRAIEALEGIKKEKLWLNSSNKVYYTQLTDVLRSYLEDQFGVSALEQTSEEILTAIDELKIQSLTQASKAELSSLFRQSDLAKFAKLEFGPLENETALNTAVHFVETSSKELTTDKEGGKNE